MNQQTVNKGFINNHFINKYSLKITVSSFLILFGVFLSYSTMAHGVDDGTKAYLENNQGVAIIPFMYIGAKHMLTGYDHLLFLVGVIFFLYRLKDVFVYVSLFTLGHSVTLLLGVLNDIQVNAYLIDAVIGFSIVYKGFDNLGGFKQLFNYQPNTKIAVAVFGLFHGFGLATKLQEFEFIKTEAAKESILQNLIAFNIGVELGQIIALAFVLIIFGFWRKYDSYLKLSSLSNTLLMSAGFMLMMFQITGYLNA